MANVFADCKQTFIDIVRSSKIAFIVYDSPLRISYKMNEKYNVITLMPLSDICCIIGFTLAKKGDIPKSYMFNNHGVDVVAVKVYNVDDILKRKKDILNYFEKHIIEIKNALTNTKRVIVEQEIQDIEEEQSEFDHRKQEILEDDGDLINEEETVVSKRIKRYQKIVRDLKEKYENKCQIEDCGFTFEQKNGNLYSEGHHLVPLSEDGPQSYSNVVILCPNHHRMFHYAKVEISDIKHDKREVKINDISTFIIYKRGS
jgi:5-methylcytosine-specific restriction endonuclease McrA